MSTEVSVRPQVLVAALLLVLATLIVLFDLWVAWRGQGGATVSAVLSGWAKEVPLLPFAIGVLIGHLFWPR